MTNQSGKLAHMGFVGKPHGIKGELSIKWFGDFTPRPGTIILLEKEDLRPHKVLSARSHKDNLLIFLEGVADRSSAELLTGSRVLLDRAQLPPLAEDEFYLDDLLGCQVYLEDGDLAGRLDHLEFPADQEIWSIMQPDGKELLFPAREEFIRDIDLDNKKIIIAPPPGLLDIYRA